jgi:hypothetical protein
LWALLVVVDHPPAFVVDLPMQWWLELPLWRLDIVIGGSAQPPQANQFLREFSCITFDSSFREKRAASASACSATRKDISSYLMHLKSVIETFLTLPRPQICMAFLAILLTASALDSLC